MRFDYSPELKDYRAEVRAFIARHGPGPRKHVGVRAPDPELVPVLRAWVARLYAAGYLGPTWPVPRDEGPDLGPVVLQFGAVVKPHGLLLYGYCQHVCSAGRHAGIVR